MRLCFFNRFYQPDIYLGTLGAAPNVLLRTPLPTRPPLRWIAILLGRIAANLAATSEIHHTSDALKMLMAGADVTMLCSVLLRRGIGHISMIKREMREWMEQKRIRLHKAAQERCKPEGLSGTERIRTRTIHAVRYSSGGDPYARLRARIIRSESSRLAPYCSHRRVSGDD